MNHALQIIVGKKPRNTGIVSYHCVSVRERLLRMLLGEPIKLTVIVPGNSVEEIGITEICERGEKHVKN